MKHRRAARVDANQTEIVRLLREIPGITVQVGHDDILVGYRKNTYWYEIKNPSQVSKVSGEVVESAKKESQKRLLSSWKGHYRIVSSIGEILEDLGIRQ